MERIVVPEGKAGVIETLMTKISVGDLTDEIQKIVTGKNDADETVEVTNAKLSLLKDLLAAYRKAELDGDTFGIGEDAVMTASRIAIDDSEFGRVLLATIAERRSAAKGLEGKTMRADVRALLDGLLTGEDDDYDFEAKELTEERGGPAYRGAVPEGYSEEPEA